MTSTPGPLLVTTLFSKYTPHVPYPHTPDQGVYRFISNVRDLVLNNTDILRELAHQTKPDNCVSMALHVAEVTRRLTQSFPEVIFWDQLPNEVHGTTPRKAFHTKDFANGPFFALDREIHRLRIPVILSCRIRDACGFNSGLNLPYFRLAKIFLRFTLLHELVHWLRGVICDEPTPEKIIGVTRNGRALVPLTGENKHGVSVLRGEGAFAFEKSFLGGEMIAFFPSSIAVTYARWSEILGIGIQLREWNTSDDGYFVINELTDEHLLQFLETLDGKSAAIFIANQPPSRPRPSFVTAFVSRSSSWASPQSHCSVVPLVDPASTSHPSPASGISPSPTTIGLLVELTSTSLTDLLSATADEHADPNRSHDPSTVFGMPVFSTRDVAHPDCCGPLPGGFSLPLYDGQGGFWRDPSLSGDENHH